MQRILLDRPKLPRNREVRACLSCRTGKLKCDRSKPRCKRCVTNNRSCGYLARASNTPPSGGVGASRIASSQGDQTIWPNQVGHLTSTSDAQLRYYNSASWLSALNDEDGASPTTSGSAYTSPGQYSGSDQLGEPPTEQLYSFNNAGEVSRLVCFFAEFCHFFYPVVDIPEIIGSLRFLESQRRSPAGSSALIAAMCYCASASLCAANDVEAASLDPDPGAWRELSHQLLFASGYPLRLTMNNLRAAFLLAASSMVEWGGTPPDPAPVCVVVRAAQSFGLHRDPDSFQQFSPREGNLRRILWWAIYSVDVGYAAAHALPPLTRASDFDVKTTIEGRGSEVEMLRSCILINQMIARAFDSIYGIRKPQKDMFQELSDDAASLYADLVGKGKHRPRGPREDFIAASERMCADKIMLIVHQPYLRSKLWPRSSRNKALDACIRYIQDFSDTITDPALAPFRWILNHWNMFHACAIILQDLTQNPHSAESAGLLDLMDATFTRFRDDLNANWKRLEPLRVKAFMANDRGCGGHPSKVEQTGLVLVDDATTVLDANASLSDWDPLFASFIWDDPSPPVDTSS